MVSAKVQPTSGSCTADQGRNDECAAVRNDRPTAEKPVHLALAGICLSEHGREREASHARCDGNPAPPARETGLERKVREHRSVTPDFQAPVTMIAERQGNDHDLGGV
jgi:hypothetical protein